MAKIFTSLVWVLTGVIIFLASGLVLFLRPLFQADEMLAQIVVEDVQHTGDQTCYIVSLEILPGSDNKRPNTLLSRQPICGDMLGLGYEFTLPEKAFWLMKKPGIVITNLVAFEKRTKSQTGNVPAGRYNIELIESLRGYIGDFLKNTPMVKSISYDIKALTQEALPGAVISYRLEPFRQQVVVECTGCRD
ncbi:hypothetical protein CSB45_11490 [candidate division KSB3 bacterium]|uniref:Uncharacterized protein n=1 Tax=candidate division KSB3 bacterium TaxID=2044937 RepID=A0A2G6E3C6_9BACT|nr:MAG: hypothetical protein CSB45_11490 [candidate division KSB3 bacterium]PIE28934.1 MAG: hypothetical protein CSA57_11535 [candidate division KSB3 bacterium]